MAIKWKQFDNQTEHILAKLIFIPDWLGSLFDS